MHVVRLRLAGFKSFADPTDFPVEPGLTGVIGPNGCGKSNLLEALRWVMGAASAKAMRGEGMDDVIFAGAAGRPPRSHAEVTLVLDNAGQSGPAAYAGAPVVEVARRIDRGQGSTYRINGAEARARDVQLLFADASTGANSPALVRQGQISELIAARPQNRRRILEEAAGISGLHGRRQEALAKVGAARANLERLEDLAREVEASRGRLAREARAAARHRSLARQIAEAEAALALAHWREATGALAAARAVAAAAADWASRATREAAAAMRALIEADAPIGARRDQVLAAAAVRARLAIEADRAERDLEAARHRIGALEGDLRRRRAELEREARLAADAGDSLGRLRSEVEAAAEALEGAPERLSALGRTAEDHGAALTEAEAAFEALAARRAAEAAERRAAEERLAARRDQAAAAEAALARACAERLALEPLIDPRAAELAAAAERASLAEAAARAAVEGAEAARAEMMRVEAEARSAMRAAEDERAAAMAAAQGLAQIARPTADPAFGAVMDEMTIEPGLEGALAAALGEDLNAGLDPEGEAHWAGREPVDMTWPAGVVALAARVRAPSALAARLAFVGLAERSAAPALQGRLPPGARLVSLDGDLWRWDGFTVSAAAPRPAQARLEQRNRLTALEARIVSLTDLARTAQGAHQAAAMRLAEAEAAARNARPLPAAAAGDAMRARQALLALERGDALRQARAEALDQALGRLQAEQAAALAALAEAARHRPEAAPEIGGDDLAAAREAVLAARDAAFGARAALERAQADQAAGAARLGRLRQEEGEWRARAAGAQGRQAGLEADLAAAEAALDAARAAPERLERRRAEVVDQMRAAAARESDEADALATAEAARREAESAARGAEARAAEAREARAAAEARLEAASARAAAAAAAILETAGLEPEALDASTDRAAPDGPLRIEPRLAALRADLAALGPVNLRAEADLAELEARMSSLAGERDDLAGALARLRQAIEALEAEGRERLGAAFKVIDGHFRDLITTLFQGGAAELRLVESEDPLESGLEVFACPPGKRLSVMSLMSGGEQALVAVALIFAVFLANPAPICVLDEVDAPLDDANVERFCDLLDAMVARGPTRFLAITHNPLTMSRMDRLLGVTMRERGVSQLVSVDLGEARRLAAS